MTKRRSLPAGSIRGIMLMLVVVGIATLPTGPSRAEYEVPYVDSNSSLANVEFRGMYSFNRGQEFGGVTSSGYEAYAVGRDPSSSNVQTNGVVFVHDGIRWRRIVSAFQAPATPFEMNAITGQINHGYGAPALYVAGANTQIGYMENYLTTIGTTVSGNPSFNRFTRVRLRNQAAGFSYSVVNPALPTMDRDFYTIDASQTYAKDVFVGGQTDGQVSTAPVDTVIRIDDPDATKFHGPLLVTGTRQDMSLMVPSGMVDPAHENIVGVRFIDLDTAYVVTSTFQATASAPGGDRYSAEGRNCTGGQTGRLYRIRTSVGTSKLKLLATQANTCFYGVAAGKLNTGVVNFNAGGQRRPHVVWVASSNGVWKYQEPSGISLNATDQPTVAVSLAQQSGTNGKTFYAVTAFPDRNGEGVNQVPNGNFDIWKNNNVGVANAPEDWLILGPSSGFNGSGACSPSNVGNDLDYQKVLDGTNPVMQVWPAKPYTSSTCATPFPFPEPVGVFARAAVPPFEGQKIRIRGRYKVDFGPANGTRPSGGTMPNYAEGGVAINCTGQQDQPSIHDPINCTVKTRRFIETYTNGTVTSGANTGNWNTFDLTISRNDLTFSEYLSPNVAGSILVRARRFDVEVVCQASYGAKVLCDDISLEDVTEPSAAPRDDFYVAAVGKANITGTGTPRTILSNSKALTVGSVFSEEQQPDYTDNPTAAVDPIRYDNQAIFASGVQHVYVAGAAIQNNTAVINRGVDTLLSRAPTTLVGYIWVGTNGKTATTGSNTGAGWISVSCINSKVNDASLCQRSSESYGWSLDLNRTTAPITGVLTGRAWFGKQGPSPDPVKDLEQIDAGTCQNAPAYQQNGNPYDLSGMCDVTANTAYSGTGVGTRRCWADAGKTTRTTRSCTNDFDCYGRCSKDPGRLCAIDTDCQIGDTTDLGADTVVGTSESTGQLVRIPAKNLQCSIDNPQSCSALGWLSLESADFPAQGPFPSGATPPTGGTIGVTFNTTDTTNAHNSANAIYGGYHELSGWARFKTLSSPAGVCSLMNQYRCTATSDCTAQNAGAGICEFASSHGTGWVHFRGDLMSTAPSPLTTYNVKDMGTGLVKNNVPYLVSCKDCYESTPATSGAFPNGGKALNCAFCTTPNRNSCSPDNTSQTATTAGYQSICTKFCYNPDSTLHVDAGNVYTECISDSQCEAAGISGGKCGEPGTCQNDYTTACRQNSECDAVAGGSGLGICSFGAFCRYTTPGSPAGATGSKCWQYGVNMSLSTGKYYGFAWSEDYGWLDYRNVGRASIRFLKTELGSIYATGSVGDATVSRPPGQCLATFLILAGGTIASNWCSSLGAAGSLSGVSPINLPDEATKYSNALGRVDVAGIINDVGGGRNKYGSAIVTLNDPNLGTALNTASGFVANQVLGGKVYRTPACASAPCNYSLNEVTTFRNSDDLSGKGSGNGILYVDGNLTIDQGMSYGTTDITDSRQMASLTVIVTGDMKIATSVLNVVGAYYVLGANGIDTSTIESGIETNPLVIRGLMIARRFTFSRRFAGTVELPAPSENIVYDGRLQTNPMPGLVDFSRVLPSQVSQP